MGVTGTMAPMGMFDDRERLERELNWDSKNEFDDSRRRVWKWWRAPLGSHAILVCTLLLALPLWLVTFAKVSIPSGLPGVGFCFGVGLLELVVTVDPTCCSPEGCTCT